jgi:fructose-1,6-bisphosphatase/inositol monophosphatase family enzyme
MNSWNLEQLIPLMLECGDLALKYYGSHHREFKEDRSLVTDADKTIEKLLAEKFDIPAEGSYMIGEETVNSRDEAYINAALKGTAWIVDPVDGTASYSNHIPTWGISVALAENGVIREGAIFLPVFGELFISDGDKVFLALRENDYRLEPLPVKWPPLDDGGLVSLSQSLSKRGRMDVANPVQAVCSCVYVLCNLLRGNYLVYVGTMRLWDMAAGMAMISKCGFAAKTDSGLDLDLNIDERFYELSAESSRRWSLKGNVSWAAEPETAEYFLRKAELAPGMAY